MIGQDTKVRPSEEVRLTSGGVITPVQLAEAIRYHAQATGTALEAVTAMVARSELVPVSWTKGGVILVYNSPNGL
ncbi:MAG: hypothetical protein A3H72_03015 [Candidatus Doudnabacteria bacterium RIFCSPLOWO2_02_FULL_48_8]|uniref:Uncharacterized protein n=1 Tax=Candidatus Doudnabacteria bacterium RIFCSPHIGHO2_01_FULL_46_24 TaxID=1817825 RepID=A0A1F5NVP3_9BACT|nr:MAG: hypothetical protein A2720_00665 [Candidatus Doudnabacteria bacterium RIFCSPHIGHO2_01_FULL_46_24]OGE95648.1 MAG: hypothetical protein A3H72_03015 [Candidatus Doudnabacteria bacterium RIFCSPLOWO2_02_FULL_48_8]OGE95982.1 MAG: hypothetical protein A3E98_04125 [Candidatus Doudnabacteria bacterium RIFCSPHIGHO2_12_FULL_48_11]